MVLFYSWTHIVLLGMMQSSLPLLCDDFCNLVIVSQFYNYAHGSMLPMNTN